MVFVKERHKLVEGRRVVPQKPNVVARSLDPVVGYNENDDPWLAYDHPHSPFVVHTLTFHRFTGYARQREFNSSVVDILCVIVWEVINVETEFAGEAY